MKRMASANYLVDTKHNKPISFWEAYQFLKGHTVCFHIILKPKEVMLFDMHITASLFRCHTS